MQCRVVRSGWYCQPPSVGAHPICQSDKRERAAGPLVATELLHKRIHHSPTATPSASAPRLRNLASVLEVPTADDAKDSYPLFPAAETPREAAPECLRGVLSRFPIVRTTGSWR